DDPPAFETEAVPADTCRVVRQKMNGYRRPSRSGSDEMNVVGRREQCVALAGCQRLLFCDLENGLFRIAPIIKATINGLVLPPPIDADDAPREMIVHRRFGANRHNQ